MARTSMPKDITPKMQEMFARRKNAVNNISGFLSSFSVQPEGVCPRDVLQKASKRSQQLRVLREETAATPYFWKSFDPQDFLGDIAELSEWAAEQMKSRVDLTFTQILPTRVPSWNGFKADFLAIFSQQPEAAYQR